MAAAPGCAFDTGTEAAATGKFGAATAGCVVGAASAAVCDCSTSTVALTASFEGCGCWISTTDSAC